MQYLKKYRFEAKPFAGGNQSNKQSQKWLSLWLRLCLMLLCSGALAPRQSTVQAQVHDAAVAGSVEHRVSGVLPKLSDSALFEQTQQRSFEYFYAGAEPHSGLARERIHTDGIYPQHDQGVVTTGGSGFGIMALLVGMERRFITREQGFKRLSKIVTFLEKAPTYHGAYSHWYEGKTGKTKPFGQKDNGGDLVETSFLMQGLLCARQYFKVGNAAEKKLAKRIDHLWRAVDFQWYTRGKPVLYWHWSPDYGWQMNFQVHGYNECLIMYVLAAASPTHSVDTAVYHQGWAMNGKIQRTSSYDGISLHFFHQGDLPNGGPLFWSQYSYLGLNPHGLKDRYGDYWKENVNQSLINYQWCVDNPKGYKGYGEDCWGLSASYSVSGYAAHRPDMGGDLGVISPTAALSAFPYTPEKSMVALRYFYDGLGARLWGKYGFYDAFSQTDNWFVQRYLAIDQGPIVVMMENYRSGFLWRLFMSCPEVQSGLDRLGFQWEMPE